MNKKIVIIVISSLLIFSLGFILCLKPFKAVVGENSSTNGLGKTINIAKDSYSEFHSLNTNYDVLDSDWLNSQFPWRGSPSSHWRSRAPRLGQRACARRRDRRGSGRHRR